MLEEKNDNLQEADGNVANDSNESVQVETTIAETSDRYQNRGCRREYCAAAEEEVDNTDAVTERKSKSIKLNR
jgi:hypothetical protein